MTQRVVAAASAVIFGLLAMMVHLLVDMHDRTSPIALDSPPRLMLDFAMSGVQGDAAIEALRSLDQGAGLGLVKQRTEVRDDLHEVVFIPLNDNPALPATVGRYQEDAARVVGQETWAHTTASGTYYVTGDVAALPQTTSELEALGVRVEREDASIWAGVQGLVRMPSMLTSFVTVCMLLATLVLYWLAMKSRRRALSVLSGIPVARIQAHDLGQLMLVVAAVGLVVSALVTVAVGLWRGWIYSPVFATYLGILGGIMLVVALLAALGMSAVSVPSPGLIARRAPATVGVRRAAGAMKAATFVVVLFAIGPAWVALDRAVTEAEQLSRWQRLADYATAEFDDANETDIQRLKPALGQVVRETEGDGSLLFSATFAREEAENDPAMIGGTMGDHFDDLLGQRWAGVSLVNQAWLEVMADDEQTHLVEVPPRDLPPQFVTEMSHAFEELWGRPADAQRTVAGLRFLTAATGKVPLIGSANELAYRDDVLVAVVPSVWETFDDGTLVNFSTGELLFAGVEETQRRLESHGLARDVTAQHAAEQGVLLARFAAYDAWLNTAAIAGLGIALALAAAISAYIASLLHARNDFARRLAGHPWPRVLTGRILPELMIGGLAAGLVAGLLRPPDQILAVVLTVGLLLAASPVMHLFAARRAFTDVTARKL